MNLTSKSQPQTLEHIYTGFPVAKLLTKRIPFKNIERIHRTSNQNRFIRYRTNHTLKHQLRAERPKVPSLEDPPPDCLWWPCVFVRKGTMFSNLKWNRKQAAHLGGFTSLRQSQTSSQSCTLGGSLTPLQPLRSHLHKLRFPN